jgi:hypothetical protein
MRLSEAIRLGSMLRPQLRGGMYAARDVAVPGDVLGLRRERVASCAFGAAYDAINARRSVVVSDGRTKSFRGDAAGAGSEIELIETPAEWSVIYITVACPVCERVEQLLRIVPHLNDDHEWTRERIADFVATVESPKAVAAVDPVEAEGRSR